MYTNKSYKETHTESLSSYLRRQCKGVVCTGTEAHWCWSEFRDACIFQAIDTRLLSRFMARERSHTVPSNQSALASLHLLEKQRKKKREIIRLEV